MDILKTKVMTDQSTDDLTVKILSFLTTFVPYAAVVAIFWKGIDAILKYASDGRDDRTRELINEVTHPLSSEIKELSKSIWDLSRKIEDKK